MCIYQEDFLMPGMFPSSASSRKQMRQRLKSRMKPLGRPHLKQRRTVRLENFGFRFDFTIIDFLAIEVEKCGRPKRRLGSSCILRLRVKIREASSRGRILLPTCGQKIRPPTRLAKYTRDARGSQTRTLTLASCFCCRENVRRRTKRSATVSVRMMKGWENMLATMPKLVCGSNSRLMPLEVGRRDGEGISPLPPLFLRM